MSARLKTTFLTLIILLVSACSQKHIQDDRVMLAPNVEMNLLSPDSFGHKLEMTQMATIDYKDQRHELLFQVEIDSQKIVLVGLTATATRLFSLVYDGKTIDINGISSVIDKIRPQYLLADLQLAYWEKSKLESRLSGAGIQVEDTATGRYIRASGDPIIELTYSEQPRFSGTLNYKHLERNYKLTIVTLDYQTQPIER